MNTYGVIYLATNRLTGEQYVGQTKQRPEVRFRAHEAASRTPKTVFHRAIAAAEYMQVSRSAISQAVTKGCKVSNKYSITEISFGL